jgi:ribonuclease G
MAEEILLSVSDGRVRVALVDAGQLISVDAAPASTRSDDASQFINRIYIGTVERVVPRLQAAFIDIGEDRAGFLGAREARVLLPDAPRDAAIEDCVMDGDTVLVQITRPPVGDKGSQVTADITLPGRGVVIAPCRQRISISRAIEDQETRTRLESTMREILDGEHGVDVNVEGMDGPAGWVVRTAAADMGLEDLKRDMDQIAKKWACLIAVAQNAEPPALLYSDLGPVERALRDHVQQDTKKIIVEGEAAFRLAQGYCREHMPDVVSQLEQSEDGEFLFDRYDIEAQISEALQPRVALPSGGWIMIETTEAMTTVDVNSGPDMSNALAVNLEAIPLIARQIQLRGIGGLVAIDFIDMRDADDNARIEAALAAAFAGDKQGVRLGVLSDFGVLEMTRRRPAQTLAMALGKAAR